MRINATIAAINSSRNLMASSEHAGKSFEKLPTAYRVNRAADDASGLSISEGLRAEIRGNTQAQRNAQDGISYIQTTEGALTEVQDMLRRMRRIAVRTAAGGGDAAEQRELDSLVSDIRSIGARTTFSGTTVFVDYSTSALSFQIGAHASDQMTAINKDLTLDAGTSGVFSAVLSLDLASVSGAHTALGALDAAIDEVAHVRSTLGAAQHGLEHTVASLSVAVENLMASVTHIHDVDTATRMVELTRSQLLADATTARLAQATAAPQSILLLLQG